MLFDKRGSNTEWKEGGWGWWCILWLFHVGGLEHVYDNRDEVTHKNTHICFWSLDLIELFSAFSFRLSHLLHKLLRFSCSSDLFLDLLVNVESYTIFHRCQQGTEDAVFLLLTFIRTSLILAITWPPRKCFKCHILLSLTSYQAEKTCGAPPGDVFCNCAFSPTVSNDASLSIFLLLWRAE